MINDQIYASKAHARCHGNRDIVAEVEDRDASGMN